MSQVTDEHRAQSPERVRCAIGTVSDTRTPETDTGGQLLFDMLVAAGFEVSARAIVRDEPSAIRTVLESHRDDPAMDAVLLTGGTGISSRDQTFETVTALLTK